MKRNSDDLNLGYEFFPEILLSRESEEAFFASSQGIARQLHYEGGAIMGQVHSNEIRYVTERGFYGGVDGLLTDRPGLLLMGTFADCVPLYFYEIGGTWIGLAHAGWRGSDGHIGEKMILRLLEEGAKKENLRGIIGPCICERCYEVSDDFTEGKHFLSPLMFREKGGRAHFDLVMENRRQLEQILSPSQIERMEQCTMETLEYQSYRRDGEASQRNIGYIGR